MLSILSFSGKSWARAAALWAVFGATVSALAGNGERIDQSAFIAASTVGAVKLLRRVDEIKEIGAAQIPRVAIRDLDLDALTADAFGDQDEPARRR